MIGKYGMMRRTYLEKFQPMKYAEMLRAGTLTDHLEQVNEEAKRLLEAQMERFEKAYPAPDRRNQLEWVQYMNALKCMAEEVIKAELIYVD